MGHQAAAEQGEAYSKPSRAASAAVEACPIPKGSYADTCHNCRFLSAASAAAERSTSAAKTSMDSAMAKISSQALDSSIDTSAAVPVVNGDSCVYECECMDSYGLPQQTVCNTQYCDFLANHYGILTCFGSGINWCRATHGYSNATRRLRPDLYHANSKTWEGMLASLFGSYKQSDEVEGDASKAVGNFPATVIVFVINVLVLAYDGKWMVKNALTTHNLWLLFSSVVYIDMFSGLLHIVLDNPKVVTWALLGPQCESFQTHHHSPTRFLTVPWFG